ncbi:MAG: TetR/AcrR family transcriptional regulator [Halioglobus sp.]
MAKEKKGKVSSVGEGEVGWQAQKSAMTRDRILEAVINCFIEEGYTNVTTAKVATNAGVSRGAMLHHFPSKTELIRATVEYLHDKLLEDYTSRVKKIPKKLTGAAHRRAGLDAYWDYLASDLFISYHELCVAGRTDPELKDILAASQAAFDEHTAESNTELFAEWKDRGELFHLAMDVTKFMMEGMAINQLTSKQDKRVSRMMDYLADRLEEIFEEGANSAITRHSQTQA